MYGIEVLRTYCGGTRCVRGAENLLVGVLDVSAVASKKEALNDIRAISLDLRLLTMSGESTSPWAASWARFSRRRLRLRDLVPDKVLGVVLLPDLVVVGVSGNYKTHILCYILL